MHADLPHLSSAGPMAGVILSGVGVVGYCYTTAAQWVATGIADRAVATAGPIIAQAAPPQDGNAQFIYGVMAMIGAIVGGWSLIQGQLNDRRRADEKKDADQAREKRVADAMADIAILTAKVELQHADHCRRLERQDHELAIIKEAVQSAPSPEAPKG